MCKIGFTDVFWVTKNFFESVKSSLTAIWRRFGSRSHIDLIKRKKITRFTIIIREYLGIFFFFFNVLVCNFFENINLLETVMLVERSKFVYFYRQDPTKQSLECFWQHMFVCHSRFFVQYMLTNLLLLPPEDPNTIFQRSYHKEWRMKNRDVIYFRTAAYFLPYEWFFWCFVVV